MIAIKLDGTHEAVVKVAVEVVVTPAGTIKVHDGGAAELEETTEALVEVAKELDGKEAATVVVGF